MNNKIESLKKELKAAYVDGYVAEDYAAQDATEDILSFTADVIADLYRECLDENEVTESVDFFKSLMQEHFENVKYGDTVNKAIRAFAEALTIIDKMHCEKQDDIYSIIECCFTVVEKYDNFSYNVSYKNIRFMLFIGRTVFGYKFYTLPDDNIDVYAKEGGCVGYLSPAELNEAYKLAKTEADKEKKSNNPSPSNADDNAVKLEFAKANLGNLLSHLLDLNSNPTDQSPLDQLKSKYCSIESKLETNNIYIVVYGNISAKILIKQNPDGTYHFKRIGKVYVLGADGKYACDLPKEDLREIEERVSEDTAEFESDKPSDKKTSDEDDECNEAEASFSPEKALESAISHLKDKISEKTGVDPDQIDVEIRKVDLGSLFKKLMEDHSDFSDDEE